MASGSGLVTQVFDALGGRAVTAWVPPVPAEAVVFAADGQLLAAWGADLARTDLPPTAVVGIHSADDEIRRVQEYALGAGTDRLPSDPDAFVAHERFVLDTVLPWVRDRLGVDPPLDRRAVPGVSAGAEFALGMGVRHPDAVGTVLAASPGAGYRPPAELPGALPRVYLVAGEQEPFFLENAVRWSDALRLRGADVVLAQRPGAHGGTFWRREFPRMIAWAFA